MDPTPSRRAVLGTLGVFTVPGCVTRVTEEFTGIREKKRELVADYDRGIKHFNAGTDAIEVAMAYEDVSRGLPETDESIKEFERALERFKAALRMARDIEHAEAVEICENAILRTEILLNGVREARAAAIAAKNNDREAVQTHLQRFKDYRDQAEGVRIVGTRTLARSLGLLDS